MYPYILGLANNNPSNISSKPDPKQLVLYASVFHKTNQVLIDYGT